MRTRSGGGKGQGGADPPAKPLPVPDTGRSSRRSQGERGMVERAQTGPSASGSVPRASTRLAREAEQQLQSASAKPRQRGQAGPERAPKRRRPNHAQATLLQAPPVASPGEEVQSSLDLLPGEVLDQILSLLAAEEGGSRIRRTCSWLRSAFDRCNTRLVLRGTAGQLPPSFAARLLNLVRNSPRVSSLTLANHADCPTWSQVLEAGGPQLQQRLEHLTLYHLPGADLSALRLASCPALRQLTLTNCPSLKDLNPLAACGQLQCLSLRACFCLKDLSPLTACIQLQSLNLHGCLCLTDLRPLAALGATLQQLDLSMDFFPSNLAPLASCTALQHLSLRGCDAVEDLRPLAACTRLQGLNLRGCSELSNLAPLASCVALQRLDLRECDLLADLGPLAACAELQVLDLSSCSRVRDLSPLSACTGLQELSLANCPWVVDLAPLAACHSLQSLDLWNCIGVRVLQPLASCRALESLYLAGCSAPNKAVKAIRAALPHQGMRMGVKPSTA